MQDQAITSPPTRSSPNKIPSIRSAAAHIAQARLLLLRVATEIPDPLELRDLRDLAGVLQYVVAAIEELEAARKLGATR